MNRDDALAALRAGGVWDVVIIGGGATGLSCALDAATRGYRTALLERGDFVSGTSSRSTKLLHGGVRYLQQGRIGFVRESLRERDHFRVQAPQLVRPMRFVLPTYSHLEKFYYGAGLKLYDLLARNRQPEPSRVLSPGETLAHLPTLRPERLRGAISYSDCQFDDAALALTLAASAWRDGAVLVNYAPVVGLRADAGKLRAATVRDTTTGETFEIEGRVIINATGVFADEVRRLDEPSSRPQLSPSQGAHIVLPRKFLPGNDALIVPRTSDGRVLFAVPWHDRVLLGTTDTATATIAENPLPFPEEIEFLLEHAARYLTPAPTRADILSAFAGLRPLLRRVGGSGNHTSGLARDHSITVSPSGLVSVTGGKWTICRAMAEQTLDRAAPVGGLPARPCMTTKRQLGEVAADPIRKNDSGPASPAASSPLLHPALSYTEADLTTAVRTVMPCTLEDVMARRTRALYLDARASAEIAPRAAALLAAALGKDAAWQSAQLASYRTLVQQHLPE